MTHLLAATQPHPGMPWAWLVGFALVAALVYAASCWIYPFAKCWVCEGSGKRSRSDGKVFRPCRWCRGTGRRLRIGRRIYNHFAMRRESAR